jgi:predicted RNA-binding Zn-ribbon protein involved in translation (DUF1610 family)
MENENIVYELCPHCEEEVKLVNEFKVQVCPSCSKHIVVCSLCPLLNEGRCSNICPLEKLAKELNKN